MDQEPDLYAVLGVPPTASQAELRKAYRVLAKRWHPDQNHNDPGASRRFVRIQSAYDVLRDETERAQYDARRARAAEEARAAEAEERPSGTSPKSHPGPSRPRTESYRPPPTREVVFAWDGFISCTSAAIRTGHGVVISLTSIDAAGIAEVRPTAPVSTLTVVGVMAAVGFWALIVTEQLVPTLVATGLAWILTRFLARLRKRPTQYWLWIAARGEV